jgi:hypothetical protein
VVFGGEPLAALAGYNNRHATEGDEESIRMKI